MDTVVTKDHKDAGINNVTTRNTDKDFGVGTLRRETPNMTPISRTRVRLAGKTQPQWAQTAAREHRGGVLPKSQPMSVYARSGNQDLAAVGLSPQQPALMGGDDAPTAPIVNDNTKKVLLFGAILGAFYLFSR